MSKKKILSKLDMCISPLVTLFFYISGFSIVDGLIIPLIKGIASKSTIERLTDPTIKAGIDISIGILLIIGIFRLIRLLEVNTKIRNMDRTKELLLRNNRPKKLEFTIQIKYAFKWVKKIINKFGKIELVISIPQGLKGIIVNKRDLNYGALNDISERGQFKLDINKLLDEVKENEIYVLIEVESKAVYNLNKPIDINVNMSCKKKYFNWLFRSIVYGISDFELDKHIAKVRIRES